MKIYRISKHDYRFITNCIGSTSEKIHSMINHPLNKDVSYEELVLNVGQDQLRELFPDYDWDDEGGLEMKDDYSVSFCESAYERMYCYYVQWSAIEFIFVSGQRVTRLDEYKGFSIGDYYPDTNEVITDFFVNDDGDGSVFAETDHEYWYNFDDELLKIK